MFTLQTSFKTTFGHSRGGVKSVDVIVNSKEEYSSKVFVPITSKNSASGEFYENAT